MTEGGSKSSARPQMSKQLRELTGPNEGTISSTTASPLAEPAVTSTPCIYISQDPTHMTVSC